jgi:alpha-tubulin suppressor-like RCC1 family protein
LFGWGNSAFGQVGIGNSNYSNPSQVGSLTTWESVSAGSQYTIAVRTDGTLWAWGNNDKGQLGLGNTTNRNSPVQVGSSTSWASGSAVGGDILASAGVVLQNTLFLTK